MGFVFVRRAAVTHSARNSEDLSLRLCVVHLLDGHGNSDACSTPVCFALHVFVWTIVWCFMINGHASFIVFHTTLRGMTAE